MFPYSQICWGFVLGCLLSLFQFNTPVFFAIFACILSLSLYFKRFLMFFVSYTCAICYVFIYYHLFYSWELPNYHRGKNYTISAQVIKVYDTDQRKIANKKLGSYFKARLLKLNNKIVSQTVYINLAWYQAKTHVNKNDIITAKARLKPYRSLQNFGNNNSELNAFYKHIKAKGYINTKYLIQIIKGEKTHFDHLKHNLATSFEKSENKNKPGSTCLFKPCVV